MPRVKLQLMSDTEWLIKAPDFCPYQDRDLATISPVICQVCRICTFVPAGIPIDSGLTDLDRAKFATYLVETNKQLAGSISGQIAHLRKNDRLPIGILISAETFLEMVKTMGYDTLRKQAVIDHIMLVGDPLAHVAGCPVYYSSKLTKTPIQVIGEIDWK